MLFVVLTTFSVNAQITSVAIVGTALGGFPSHNEINVKQLFLVIGTTDHYILNGLVATCGNFKL